jgi:hypothetical protein
MSNEMKNVPRGLNGFSGFTNDKIKSKERRPTNRILVGELIKFTTESGWTLRSGETLPPDLEFVVVWTRPVIQKWKDGKPIDTVTLQPGEQFPDVNKMNEETPRSEWTQWPGGQPRGPWEAQHFCYMFDLRTRREFTYPTGTKGGQIAISDLTKQTEWMRRHCGRNVLPVVQLSDCFMRTRNGDRRRPCFLVKRWIAPRDASAEAKAPALTGPDDTAVEPPGETKAPGGETCGDTSGDESGTPTQPLGTFAGSRIAAPIKLNDPAGTNWHAPTELKALIFAGLRFFVITLRLDRFQGLVEVNDLPAEVDINDEALVCCRCGGL